MSVETLGPCPRALFFRVHISRVSELKNAMKEKIYSKDRRAFSRRGLRIATILLAYEFVALYSGCRTPPTLQELSERYPEAVNEAKERLREMGGIR